MKSMAFKDFKFYIGYHLVITITHTNTNAKTKTIFPHQKNVHPRFRGPLRPWIFFRDDFFQWWLFLGVTIFHWSSVRFGVELFVTIFKNHFRNNIPDFVSIFFTIIVMCLIRSNLKLEEAINKQIKSRGWNGTAHDSWRKKTIH